MTLFKRFGYYLAGFSVGLIVLAIFLKKKNAEFCYGIDCRILKNIRSKNLVYSDQASQIMDRKLIDSVSIQYILKKGDVNMSKSNTTLDSCKIYYIEGETKVQSVFLTVENCDSIATIQRIDYK